MISFVIRSKFCNLIGIGITSVLLNLSGCSFVGPDFVPPCPPETSSYIQDKCIAPKTAGVETANAKSANDKYLEQRNNAGIAQYFRCDSDIPALWWEVFHSESLNEVVCLGIQNSPTVQAAIAALKQAKSNYLSTWGSVFMPLVQAQWQGDDMRLSDASFAGFKGFTTVESTPFTLYNTQLNVSYVLDVWGGGRRRLEGLAAQIEYQRFQLEAAYLSLSSNIVATIIQEASLRAQIDATHELIRLAQNQLNIIKTQFKLGGVSQTDVLNQETILLNYIASLPPLEKGLAQTRHLLAVLVGELPSEDCLPKFNFNNLTLPKNLPLTLPSNLICQRPDIRASMALLHQASANIGVVTASMLPNVTLSGYYGWDGNLLGSLMTPENLIWTWGGQVLQTLFQGGALYYARRSALEGFQQAEAQYCQTVLKAFQNVADTLRAIQQDAIAFKEQTAALQVAKKTLQLAETQFKLGGINYLSLLNSQQQYQNARLNQIKAKAARFSDTVTLFQALGGGWWNKCYYQQFLTPCCNEE